MSIENEVDKLIARLKLTPEEQRSWNRYVAQRFGKQIKEDQLFKPRPHKKIKLEPKPVQTGIIKPDWRSYYSGSVE